MLSHRDGQDGFTELLVTAHKGVDLHAATARRVMRDRLLGGDRLADLRRCEFHAFGGPVRGGGPRLADLLATGRFFNPNKHRHGHFELSAPFAWTTGTGEGFPVGWPGGADGAAAATARGALNELLGGPAPAGRTAVDVAAWARGQEGPIISGTLWRLVIAGTPESALESARLLAVARGGREGLLVNPHMECWLLAAGD
ncbi:MAG: hypothetical protein IPK64_11945 [bacterium]|nr:hypothetical protein [bacterium]